MAVFGCATDEQFKFESNSKIKKSDFRKLKDFYALAMEDFLKEKGLFDEFYARKILANIKLSIDSNDLILSENITFKE